VLASASTWTRNSGPGCYEDIGAQLTTIENIDAIERSRRAILEELGDPPDLTVAWTRGNVGDLLIAAGVRALLADRVYREVDLDGMCCATGHTVLLSGSGAFSRDYHELMPRALAVAGLRFERAIVLPSSFDPGEDIVREALSLTEATVFAREPESFRRIVSLCDARLAHDCAFFFDYAPYRRQGRGTLNAFRTDKEGLPGRSLPPDNDDVSASASGLDQWLGRIADHALVRTDRAHVMIAGALLGKQVEYAPSNYHKLEAIARYSLADRPVTLIDEQLVKPGSRGLQPRRTARRAARVNAIVVTRDRPDRAARAVESVFSSATAAEAIVLDNNSSTLNARALQAAMSGLSAVTLQRSDRNLGCAGGRSHALTRASAEFVLFLDDDAELAHGALDDLVADLDAHPDALATSAVVLLPDGLVQHSGGWLAVERDRVRFGLIGDGLACADELPPSGPADWVPGTAALLRRSALERYPLDPRMSSYYEDNEWSYRVWLERPASLRRSREAHAIHHLAGKHFAGVDFATRSAAVELLAAQAAFLERHGKLLDIDLFGLVPELRTESGHCDVVAARLLIELIGSKGTDWVFARWMSGELEPLLGHSRAVEALEQRDGVIAARDAELAERSDLIDFLYRRHQTLERVENGGWWRLRTRLLPALRLLSRLRGRESS
jgi:GT2 family glycosyltransferase